MQARPKRKIHVFTMAELLSFFMSQNPQEANDRHTPQLSAGEYIDLTLEHADVEKEAEALLDAAKLEQKPEYAQELNVLTLVDYVMHHQLNFHSQEAKERLAEVMTEGANATNDMLVNRLAGRDNLARNYAATGMFARPASPLKSSSSSLSTSGSSSEFDLDSSTEESSSSLRM